MCEPSTVTESPPPRMTTYVLSHMWRDVVRLASYAGRVYTDDVDTRSTILTELASVRRALNEAKFQDRSAQARMLGYAIEAMASCAQRILADCQHDGLAGSMRRRIHPTLLDTVSEALP